MNELLHNLFLGLPTFPLTWETLGWAIYPLAYFIYFLFWNSVLVVLVKLFLRAGVNDAWYETARKIYPFRAISGFLVPFAVLFSFTSSFVFYRTSYPIPNWLFSILCVTGSFFGVVTLGTWLGNLLGLPKPPLGLTLRSRCSVFIIWILYLLMGVLCMGLFAWTGYGPLIGMIATLLLVIISLRIGLTVFILWLCGLIRQPTSKLVALRDIVSDQMKMPSRPRVRELLSPTANAFAYQSLRMVLVSSKALSMFSDDELKSILRHEFAHLTESRAQQYIRYLPLICYFLFLGLYLVLFKGTTGTMLFFPSLLVAIFVLKFAGGRISKKLEIRADEHAKSEAGDSDEVYALALEELYISNLVPPVLRAKLGTHPDLYDRMLKCGVSPTYPRPNPPPRRLRILTLMAMLITTIVVYAAVAAIHVKSFDTRNAMYEDDDD